MKVDILQYLDQKPRLGNSWRADMVRLLDAYNDDLQDAKTSTKNHVIHSRISEVQHALEHIAQEFLNTERDNTREMGYGFYTVFNEKVLSYEKAHAEAKPPKPQEKHATYKSLVKAKRLSKALAKTINLLVETKKFRNFIVADWFECMARYFKLLMTYEKFD